MYNVPMPFEANLVEAICFDIDGTLNDTDDQYVARLVPYLSLVKLLLPNRNPDRAARRLVMFLEAPGNFVLGLPDMFGLDGSVNWFLNMLNRGNKKKLRVYKPINGVLDMVPRLAAKYKLSVVSARSEETTRDFLNKTGLNAFIPVVVGALTAEHTKPYPDPVLFAAAEMGVSPSRCVMVGDTVVDIRAGKAAGAQAVGVLCGFGEEGELQKAKADAIMETTSALEKLLMG